ncbi:MAG: hypothetical protein HOC74_14175 [Gemmatimonadetes bacterium]|jgi:hypothetical protein|nr:hypothetical protein [Gemmatimonadota bacterium]
MAIKKEKGFVYKGVISKEKIIGEARGRLGNYQEIYHPEADERARKAISG